jgi:hypothetical protein
MKNATIDYAQFCAHLNDAAPPPVIVAELAALWWSHRGDWDKAHQIVQDIDSIAAAGVHGYLHRVEGDLENAAYWYKRADQRVCELTLAEEWETLVRNLLRSF